MSDKTTYWPYEPPEDAVVLVRATGTILIEKVRRTLEASKIPFTMGGQSKNDLTFYVPEAHRAEAKKLVQESL